MRCMPFGGDGGVMNYIAPKIRCGADGGMNSLSTLAILLISGLEVLRKVGAALHNAAATNSQGCACRYYGNTRCHNLPKVPYWQVRKIVDHA